jgi:chromosome segregation ATPase
MNKHRSVGKNDLIMKLWTVSGMQEQILDLLVKMNVRQERMEGRLESLDDRQQKMEGRLESIDDRQQKMEGRLESLDDRQQKMEGRLESIDDRQQKMEDSLGLVYETVKRIESAQTEDVIGLLKLQKNKVNFEVDYVNSKLTEMDKRIYNLEKTVES